ncbi:MAG: replication protein [Patescibacteria group bacterium]|nr:replication protein [Patescibacteria group bacterium]MDE2019416.1 replication protein [Patescibacteria group bacterium]
MDKIIPNTTQVPNFILDDLLPRLKDVEFRVLLVVVRQTLGWVEDSETGRRKEKDWISRSQIMKKTGRGHASISSAIEKLVRNELIEARDANGKILKTGKDRSGNKIFYRLNLEPKNSLFAVHKPVQKMDRSAQPVQNLDVQNLDTTKETLNTTKEAKAAKLPTNDILREFNRLSIAMRREKPTFVRFKDGHLIKTALRHLSEGQLRMLLVWFLHEKRNMRPSIGSALCGSVIGEFIRQSEREYGFYRKLENLYRQYEIPPPEVDEAVGLPAMVARLAELKRNLFGSLHRENAEANSP